MILSVIWFGINREAYVPTKMPNVWNNITKILSTGKVTQTFLPSFNCLACNTVKEWHVQSLWYSKYPQFSLVPNDPNNCLEMSFSYLLFINFSQYFYMEKLVLKTVSMQLMRGIW